MFEEIRLKYSRGIVDPRLVIGLNIISEVQEQNIQGNSVDLTVGEVYTSSGDVHLKSSGERKLPTFTLVEPYTSVLGEETYCLQPNEVYQVEFREQVKLPYYLCGITLVRSTLAKSGTSGENGLFDSSYEGSTGMMVTVKNTLYLQKGSPIAQMVFFRSHAKGRPYKGFYKGKKNPVEW